MATETYGYKSLLKSQEFLLAIYLVGVYIANEIRLMTGFSNANLLLFSIIGIAIILRAITRWKDLATNTHCIYPIVLASLLIVLTIIQPDYSRVSLVHVIMFSIIPFFIFINEFDGLKLLRSILLLSVLLIPSAYLLFGIHDDTWTMPLSYALTTPVIASMVLIRYYSRYVRLVDRALIALSVVFFLTMLFFGKRGPILVVLVCAILLLIKPPAKRSGMSLKQVFALVTTIIAVFAIFSNIELIAVSLAGFLSGFGIVANALTRTVELLNTQYGASAGRGELLPVSIELFLKNPIFGNGIGSFYYINIGGHEMTYPHNLVLQLLDDGGIVLTVLVLFPIIRSFPKALASDKCDMYSIYLFLFALAIPHLLVSSEIFHQPELWCLLAYSHYCNSKAPNSIINAPETVKRHESLDWRLDAS